jgi:DNA segregation ATPase FtsK/SpoIIIE, S-DNA-T family
MQDHGKAAHSKKEPDDECRAGAEAAPVRGPFLLILVAAVYLLLVCSVTTRAIRAGRAMRPEDRSTTWADPFGAWLADLFLVLFGYMAYVAPLLIGFAGFRVLQ